MAVPAFSTQAIIEGPVEGIAFGDLLRYLNEQYGLAHQVVGDTLSELAGILGYESVGLSTWINFSDTKILMEEVGTQPATEKEFAMFLSEHGTVVPQPVGSSVDDVHDFYQLKNYLDLVDLARDRGITMEPAPKNGKWSRVIMTDGTELLYKTSKGKLRWASMA